MEEREVLLRAKEYIEKLANGVNPLDDSKVGDDDIVNNVRISRCLFYVANVLQDVINRKSRVRSSKSKREKFDISQEQIDKIEIVKNPITISELIGKINSFVNVDSMRRLSYKKVVDWLKKNNIMTTFIDEKGKSRSKPTEYGENIGFKLERRLSSSYGEYYTTIINEDAQRFILDYLFEIAKEEN